LLDSYPSLDALDRIDEGIFALDSHGRISYVNRSARRLLPRLIGATGDNIVGTVIWNASPSFAHTPMGIALRRAQTEGGFVTQMVRDPASGSDLELRVYPSAEGASVLLRSPAPAPSAEVLDRVSDLYFACDGDWRLTFVNARTREYLRLLGLSQEEPLGRSVWEVIPGLAGTRFQAEAFRAMVEQTEVELEAVFPPLNRWFSARITPMEDGVIACARDITGWRQSRAALTREAERLAEVIRTQQAVITAGPDLGAVMHVVSERLQALTGASAAGVFLPEEDELVLCEGSGGARSALGQRLPLSGSLVGRCYTSGEMIRCDDTTIDPRVHQTSVQALQVRSGLLVPLRGTQGTQAVVSIWSDRPRAFHQVHEQTLELLAGLLSAAMERASSFAANQLLLGERTAALAALRIGEERFRQLVESIDDVVFRLDRQHRCVDVFGQWLEREGLRADDLIGRTTSEIVGREEAAVHDRANLRALAGETVTYEWTLRTLRGLRHMKTILSPLRGAEGEITGIVGVGRDISQRIEAEQQIRQAQKMEAVGRFAGGVAHDLNNMMMIIMGFSDFLLGALEPEDPRSSDAEEIRKAAERAMHLTRQLLAFGRHRVVAREVLNLNDVVTGMERMLRPLVGEDIALVTHLSPEVGGVEADYGQLEQVVMNLALNSRDAMQPGGRLTIETMDVDFPEGYASEHLGFDIPAGPYVLMVVGDTGHGMTAEVKAHLFEPFFTTKPTTHNSGLGLATVYGIVVQSGGYIWVDSAPDHGTSFKICFPRVSAEDAVSSADVEIPESARGTETVLLVEDEDVVRALASRALTSHGYVVLEARNGREALALVEQSPDRVDLVLTDVVMPEMGGPQLVEQLHEALPDARIMYMSGYTEGDKLQPGIRSSPYPFLQKPFSPDNLCLRVREALDTAPR
jgi:PAS domain S-box-containing protein